MKLDNGKMLSILALASFGLAALADSGVIYQRQLLDEARDWNRDQCWSQVTQRHAQSWNLESVACRAKKGTPSEDTSPERRELSGADGKYHCLLTSTFYCFGSADTDPTTQPEPQPEPPPQQTPHPNPIPASHEPRYIGEVDFSLDYWSPLETIALNGTLIAKPWRHWLNASVAARDVSVWEWAPTTGTLEQKEKADDFSIDLMTYLGNQLIVSSNMTLYKHGEERTQKGFPLYAIHPNGSYKLTQLESSGTFLYALSPNGNAIQIVNTQGRDGWEQVLPKDSLIKFDTVGDGFERFAVNEKWLVLNNSRPWNGKTPFLLVYDVSDPYSPRAVTKIELTGTKVNDLNGWHPIVADDRVFVPVGKSIVSYDLQTGSRLGSVSLPEEAGKSRAAVVIGDRLFVGGHYSAYEISIADHAKLELVQSFRVTHDAEAKGIVLLHHVGNSLAAIWESRDYGNGKDEKNFRITTFELQ